MIGTVVGDKYRILRRLGAGGMGTVYAATHAHTGRAVALKLLARDLGSEPSTSSDPSDTLRARYDELLDRFRLEALAAGKIRSEHVVQILDAGQNGPGGTPFLVMEMLEGDTVQNLCKKIGAIEPHGAITIAAQACRGLVDAHAAGIIHRDIKSANLIVSKTPTGEAITKILDFGIAKVVMDEFQANGESGLTRTGNMLGSPQYMSPEQARGLKSIDFRADVWSLGVVLYRMLVGAPPFNPGPLGQVLLAICTEAPPPVRERAPWVKSSVERIVMRALEKDPARRFATAHAMLEALLGELGSTHSKLRYDEILVAQRTARAAEPLPAFESPTLVPNGFDTGTKMTMQASPVAALGEPTTGPRRSRAGGIVLGTLLAGAAVAGVGYFATRSPSPVAAANEGKSAPSVEPKADATPTASAAQAAASTPTTTPSSAAPIASVTEGSSSPAAAAERPAAHDRRRSAPLAKGKPTEATPPPTPAAPPSKPPTAPPGKPPAGKNGVGATNSFD